MGELLILAIVVLALAGCGGACVWGWRRLKGGEEGARAVGVGGGANAGPALEDGSRDASATAGPSGEPAGPDPSGGGDGGGGRLDELKRRYVEGEITLEEYERALDELDFREEL